MEMKNGDIVKLIPKNEYAKCRIDQQQSNWVVEAISERILFETKEGVWLGLREHSNNNSGIFRWVHLTDDDFFDVLKQNKNLC